MLNVSKNDEKLQNVVGLTVDEETKKWNQQSFLLSDKRIIIKLYYYYYSVEDCAIVSWNHVLPTIDPPPILRMKAVSNFL